MDNKLIIALFLTIIGLILALWALRDFSKERRLKQYGILNNKKSVGISLLERSSKLLGQVTNSDIKNISENLISAGFYNPRLSKYFLPMKYGFLIIGELVIAFISHVFLWQNISWFIVGTIWLMFILVFPDFYINIRRKNLIYNISGKLPYLIDLMAVCVQTGMTIEASLEYLTKEMYAFDRDLSYQLARVNEKVRVVGLPQALDELYMRIPSNEMRSFVITIKQSLQFGTSIYNVLITLSSDIREIQLLRIEEKIGKLSAKMSVPLIVFIMLPIVVLVAAPGVMRMLLDA